LTRIYTVKLSEPAVMGTRRTGALRPTADRSAVAYLVGRFPLITETFVLRELDALADRVAFPIELFALRPGRGSTLHSMATRWLPGMQVASIFRGCHELLRLTVTRPRVVARVLRAVVQDYGREPGELVEALVVVVLAASFVPAVRRGRVAHIHAHFAAYPAEAAWALAAFTGTSYSVTAHAYDLFVNTPGLDRRISGARFVACISEYNRRFLRARCTARAEFPLVRCGVPTTEMRRPAHAPNAQSPRLIMVSSFQPKKGHAVLVRAIQNSPALRSAQLDLVGAGPLEPAIHSLVHAAELDDRVTFHGAQPEDVVRRMVADSDVLVQPSVVAPNGDMDGIPNTLIEAMALGIPVVTTSVSGIPELVIDGVTGVVVRPGDHEELAAGLQRVIDEPEAARKRAAAGLARVGAEFDIVHSAEAMASLLERVLERRGSVSAEDIVIPKGFGPYFDHAAHSVRGVRKR
jgi:colanic acid/amylovoran biosynthesis glycosyltransferase